MFKKISVLFVMMVVVFFTINCSAKSVVVQMETSLGKIEIELYEDKAPITVMNFLKYVDKGFYNETIFHRVIPSFMIQGGGFTSDMGKKKTLDPIRNEANNGLSNSRGTISMARTNEIHSGSSQFFINVRNNANLDYKGRTSSLFGYCVFGKVIKGMNVVDKIENVKTGNISYFRNVPLKPIRIISIKRK